MIPITSTTNLDNAPQAPSRAQRLKFAIFSLALVVMVLVALDVLVRVAGLDEPTLSSPLMPMFDIDFRRVHQNDDELFYALKPNVSTVFNRVQITTNSLGLRSPEFGVKEPSEFRVLSLGESSAFGAGVLDNETYAARLEKHLAEADQTRKYRVINAGVSAYTSFQSRIFLEKRGLDLEPDMVIIYHEFNDFLPTTNRDALAPDSIGISMSDKELHESQRHSMNRRLLNISALYRLVTHLLVNRKIDAYQAEADNEKAGHIVVPEQLRRISTPEGVRALDLPPRVPLKDREENLDRMRTLCAENGIQFVVIHPSYAESDRHECDLTEYCRRNNVPMFEAYDSLHPAQAPPEPLYWDLWHPNAEGHRRLAQHLFQFLMNQKLVPAAN